MFWIGTKSMIGTEIVLGRLMPMHPGSRWSDNVLLSAHCMMARGISKN